jgi:hypothetical protein
MLQSIEYQDYSDFLTDDLLLTDYLLFTLNIL